MLDLLRRLDRALLDRVFQPVADRVAALAEPRVLAESALIGAAVMTLGQVATDLRLQGLDPGTVLFGALNLGGAVWLVRWYRAHGSLSRGSANPFREMPIWVLFRMVGVADLCLSALLPLAGLRAVGVGPVSLSLGSGDQSTLFDVAASLLSTCGLYFAACTLPPPNRRLPARAVGEAA